MWYLLGSKKSSEQTASGSLTAQGFETYLPMDDDGPLFEGYFFAEITNQDIEPIRRSPYCWLPYFHEAPDSLVQELQATEWRRIGQFEPGSKVRITSGPFNRYEAIVKAKAKDRIILLMNFMQREKEVPFNISQVEPA